MTTPNADYVSLGDVCRSRLRIQAQYGARYVRGDHGSPALGADLRIEGEARDYHAMTIHRDDVDEFVRRVTAQIDGSGAPT